MKSNHPKPTQPRRARLRQDKVVITTVVIMIATMTSIVVAWVILQNRQEKIEYTLDVVLRKLNQPVGVFNAGDNRLFINERNGIVRILDTGELVQQPFLDIRDRVNIEDNIEQGLLSLAFDPNYAENGYLFVTYTDSDFTVHLERFEISDNPNIVDTDSGIVLLSVEQRTSAHNGGTLRFGIDGYLYMSIGDGGMSLNPLSTGQNKDDLLGKILRLDVSNDQPYSIPPDNPFINDPEARPEIWAMGFRNPWQFSFVPDSDAMFITDVGWSTFEEINYQPANSRGGKNYGWKLYEGNSPIEPQAGSIPVDVAKEDLEFPIYIYPHSKPDDYDASFPVGCAIIGGFVYRGEALQQLQGKYLYSDFCHGQIWALSQNGDEWETELLVEINRRVTSLGEGTDGEVYMTTYLGDLRKLIIIDDSRFAPDGDIDYDLIENAEDNCPEVGNPNQSDNWGDVGVGDACDQNVYTNGSSVYEIKIFQQNYGAFHIYGCEGHDCNFVASIEQDNLSADAAVQIHSETVAGILVDVENVSETATDAVYSVTIYATDGNVLVDNFQIVKSENSLRWRTIS